MASELYVPVEEKDFFEDLDPLIVKAIESAEERSLCKKEDLDLNKCRKSRIDPGKVLLVKKSGRKIGLIEPERKRGKETLDYKQKLFHLSQRSLASKGYIETITWSFTNSNIDKQFSKGEKDIPILNPISSDSIRGIITPGVSNKKIFGSVVICSSVRIVAPLSTSQ